MAGIKFGETVKNPYWRIFNLAKLSQSAWPEYEHTVLVEVRSVQAATRIVSRSQLDSHARSESGYARLLREVSHGWALLQVSSRMAWWCEFLLVLPFASPRTRFTLSLLSTLDLLPRERNPRTCVPRS